MMHLYLSPGTSSLAAHIALNEAGATFTTTSLALGTETRTPEFVAINPLGKVPTLVVDGRVITEVAGILYYVARRFPEAGLLPADIEGQAEVVSWMSFCASTVHPARRESVENAVEVYRIAERKLAGRDWCVGQYSVADMHLFRLYWRFHGALQQPSGTFPALEAHHARMLARPAVRRTLEAEGYRAEAHPPPA